MVALQRGGPLAEHYASAIRESDDPEFLALNEKTFEELPCEKRLEVIEDAGYLFEGPGEQEAVSELPADWFVEHL